VAIESMTNSPIDTNEIKINNTIKQMDKELNKIKTKMKQKKQNR
jgi:hypothetical protein